MGNVYKCTGAPTPQDIEQVLGWLLNQDFASAFEHAAQLMAEKALALQDVLTGLHEYVLLLELPDALIKANLVAALSDVELRLSTGTSEKIQLAGLVGIFQQTKVAILNAA